MPERETSAASAASKPKRAIASTPAPARKRRLTYKETSELASLPDEIDRREKEREQIYTSLSDPAFLRDGAAVVAARDRLNEIELEMTWLMERWEELETIASDS